MKIKIDFIKAAALLLIVLSLTSGCDSDDSTSANSGPQTLTCPDGTVPQDTNGTPVTYLGSMTGNDYIAKSDQYCIDNPADKAPAPGGGDEASADSLVSDAQNVIGTDYSNTVANKIADKLKNQTASSASDGGVLNFSKPGGAHSQAGSGSGSGSDAGRGLAGDGSGSGTGPAGFGSSGNSGLDGGLAELALQKDAADKANAGGDVDANKDKSGASNFQGTTGGNGGATGLGSRMGALDSAGGGGAVGGLLDGISTNRALTLFEVVNRRYDRWNRTVLDR